MHPVPPPARPRPAAWGRSAIFLPLIFLLAAAPGRVALAGQEDFHAGKAIAEYGQVATVDGATLPGAQSRFKVAFDVSTPAEAGSANRQMESAARLLNLLAEAGVAPAHTRVAIVVHGRAAMDLVSDARLSGTNASAGLVAALIGAGASIQLCGQTAAYYDIAAADLLPGVTLSLSAMTAHAQLQQQGFSLNPF